MPKYVDGFLLPVPKRRLAEYQRIAQRAAKVWLEHGALDYRECVIEDQRAPGLVPFRKSTRVRRGETVILAWIVYKSRAQRDRVNAKVMKDPRISEGLDMKNLPFDMKRMAYGGFTTIVGD